MKRILHDERMKSLPKETGAAVLERDHLKEHGMS